MFCSSRQLGVSPLIFVVGGGGVVVGVVVVVVSWSFCLPRNERKKKKKKKKKQKRILQMSVKSQPRKIQFLPTSCWLNFSAPIFFVWLLHIFARTQTKETPSDLCTFDLAIGLFVFLGYFFFLFLLISPHCGYFFLLLSLGSWVFMVNFPSKWMLFCLHSNS